MKQEKVPTIAVTGGIASGKSAFARFLADQGAECIDADQLAREVVAPGTAGLAEVLTKFGPEFLLNDGNLDRKALAKVIFSDPAKRRELEQILHPKIRALYAKRLAQAQTRRPPLIVYVVPLLFESKHDQHGIDAVVLVSASAAVCRERIINRDGSTAAEAEAKISSQLPIEEKERLADIVIKNEGSLESLRAQAKAVFDRFCLRTTSS